MTNSRIITFLIITAAFYSCKKDRSDKVILPENNKWIQDSMQVYYYWNDQLPAKPEASLSATTFFKSLLNTADRFSYIESPDEVKTEYSSFAWYGFEYAFIESDAFPGRLAGTITLVVPDGPADRAGLKRGDIFTAVNGSEINTTTSSGIKKTLNEGGGVELKTASMINDELKEGPGINITYTRYTEQPVYLTRIFASGSKKTGYVFYNWFSGNHDYNILDSLNKLKSAGVSELILDMRYNPGGDVSTAAKVAATLTNTTDVQVFAVYQANKNGGRLNKTFHDLITENNYQPQAFSEMKNRRLNLNRVFVLTTGATASAAELLINSLKPFIQVIQIGQVTTGKDMASFAIDDRREPKLINLVLHPLIFKLYNSLGSGDYPNGLTPDYIVDEFSVLPLKPFGDPQDPLTKKALEVVNGGDINLSRLKTASTVLKAQPLYQSTVEHSKSSDPILVSHVVFNNKK